MATKADLERYALIQQMGCVACREHDIFSMCDVHHLNSGGHAGQVRRGNQSTIGLCPYHHRGIWRSEIKLQHMIDEYGPSLALTPRRFRERYGSDDELLAKVDNWIKEHQHGKLPVYTLGGAVPFINVPESKK